MNMKFRIKKFVLSVITYILQGVSDTKVILFYSQCNFGLGSQTAEICYSVKIPLKHSGESKNNA